MDFGYFANISNPGLVRSYGQILNEVRDLSVTIEDAGWDSIWFTEHHFGHEGFEVCPNPIMLCTDIAARTSRTPSRSGSKHCYFLESFTFR